LIFSAFYGIIVAQMAIEINTSSAVEKSPKKRILLVITQSEFGGAQRFLYDLIKNLDPEKYDILLAVGKDGTVNSFETKGLKTYKLNFLRRNINPFYDIRASWELKKLIKDFDPQILFLNSSKAGFIGSFVSKYLIQNTKYKILYRIGGWSFNDPRSKPERWFWKILERTSAKWKDIIIVNNKHDFDQAIKFKIKPREKIVLVYNGLDVYKTNLLSREEAQLKLQDAAPSMDRPYPYIVGTIANFYPSKGLEYLVETAEHFKNNDNIVFVIIGDGPERFKIENLIEQRGLHKKVFLLGQIPDAYKLLGAFDIFVLPSVKEGFPWTVIEAMAAKLPVVATKVGAIPEIIEDGKNGFVVGPGHPEQIAAKIQDLLTNKHLRQELGIQAHQTVLFKFSLEKMVREIEILL